MISWNKTCNQNGFEHHFIDTWSGNTGNNFVAQCTVCLLVEKHTKEPICPYCNQEKF